MVAAYGGKVFDRQPADVSLADVWVEGYAATTAGLSLALPIPVFEEHLDQVAAGITVKYTLGHAVAVGRSAGRIEAESLQADLDSYLIHTRITDDLEVADYVNGGSGIGLDLGLMVSLDRLTVGAAVQNLFNTFAWDESLLTYRRVTAAFEDNSLSFDHGEQPYGEAPAEARELIAELTFKPALRLGAAYLVLDELTVSSDIHYRFGDGIALDPRFHLGAGAEYRPLDFLHLRGGLALVTGGLQYGGGVSFILGPVNLSVAAAGQPGGRHRPGRALLRQPAAGGAGSLSYSLGPELPQGRPSTTSRWRAPSGGDSSRLTR